MAMELEEALALKQLVTQKEEEAIQAAHAFHAIAGDINLGNEGGSVEISADRVHIGHNINLYHNSSPPINHALVRQHLQKSLSARYEKYTHLERLFDNSKTPIADSFINLAIIKETEHKAKEQSLARSGLEEKDDSDRREKSRENVIIASAGQKQD